MTIDYLNRTTAQILKERFQTIKKELRARRLLDKIKFIAFVFEKEPQFNSPEGMIKISNVWTSNVPDLRLTELMQEFKSEQLNS
jgi:hypothetical protein